MGENTISQAAKTGRGLETGRVLIICLLCCLVLFIGWGLWQAAFPPRAPLQGQMEARTINVASRVPGRVLEVLVKEGDFIEKGQPVVRMHLPELEAKLLQAKAQASAAMARESLVDEGPRPQEKAAARAEWERAKAAAALAEKTWRRIAALYGDGLVSRQRYDEISAERIATANQAMAAREQYNIAMIGARSQEKSTAADLSREASAGVEEIASLAANRELVAPVAGQVDKVILVPGEIAGAGFPVLTIVNVQDQWATFNIRESEMPGIEIGRTIEAAVPAIGTEKLPFEIYYISPRANYATWRSTRQNSGYDMKTFEVRARPGQRPPALRPGMSVLVNLK